MKKRYALEQKRWDSPAEHAMPEHSRVPASFTVGTVRIAPATVLAPMAGVTDTVFRRFIKQRQRVCYASPSVILQVICDPATQRRICIFSSRHVEPTPPTSNPAVASS